MKASRLINIECRIEKSSDTIGRVVEIIVDPKKPRVVGVAVKKNRWLGTALLVEIDRVVECWNATLTLKTREVNNPLLSDCSVIFESRLLVLGRRAFSKDGEKLGIVSDIYFDLDTGWISKFVIDRGVGFWKKSNILAANSYIETNPGGVIFDTSGNLVREAGAVKLELAG